MRVHAIGTAVDLRDAQIDLIDELGGQIRLSDIGVNAAKGLYADRSNGGVVQPLGHGTFLKVGLDNASVLGRTNRFWRADDWADSPHNRSPESRRGWGEKRPALGRKGTRKGGRPKTA